jgi:hypothetical protein
MKSLILLLFLLPACSSSDHAASVRQRQDEALRDPMNWSPDTSQHNDISGGGTADFKKDSMKKDINSVFGP